ncbi:MAG: CIA30 family protein [Gammaproteobacteria bacterium]
MFIRCWVLLFLLGGSAVMADDLLIIDDRHTGNLDSTLGTSWRMVTDGVMGGVSSGTLTLASMDKRDCLRLQGDVRLENNGGFVQAALDIGKTAAADASAYTGIVMDVYGNDEAYNLHLRTTDLWLPWQSYRATFQAPASWQTVQLPFAGFSPYKTGKALDLTRLERIGVLAIGRAFSADLCIGRVGFYK